jgi:hypothetical protein
MTRRLYNYIQEFGNINIYNVITKHIQLWNNTGVKRNVLQIYSEYVVMYNTAFCFAEKENIK